MWTFHFLFLSVITFIRLFFLDLLFCIWLEIPTKTGWADLMYLFETATSGSHFCWLNNLNCQQHAAVLKWSSNYSNWLWGSRPLIAWFAIPHALVRSIFHFPWCLLFRVYVELHSHLKCASLCWWVKQIIQITLCKCTRIHVCKCLGTKWITLRK